MMSRNVYLSVIIPVYNEETKIAETLLKINHYVSRQDYSSEIIIVNDGSTDNTIGVARKTLKNISLKSLSLSREINRGKGYSVKEGVLQANGEFILFSDADLSTPFEELEKLMPWIDKGYDIVIGSRGLKDSDIQIPQSRLREISGKVYNVLVQCLIIRGIKDTQCGFKLFKRAVALDVFKRQRIEGFSFDVEILFIAKRLGYKIKEVPIVWRDSRPSKVRIPVVPFKMLWELFKIRLRSKRKEKY
ncbi:MAG: glycosyltransferase [Candidatus Aminicenantes bacterium]|nr:glycosyltransferase [Candidatus Aminicenantes bacterium]